jgi:hypothetical protein
MGVVSGMAQFPALLRLFPILGLGVSHGLPLHVGRVIAATSA